MFELADQGIFDELWIEHWFHAEQMDERFWVIRAGGRGFLVTIGVDGEVEVVEGG